MEKLPCLARESKAGGVRILTTCTYGTSKASVQRWRKITDETIQYELRGEKRNKNLQMKRTQVSTI